MHLSPLHRRTACLHLKPPATSKLLLILSVLIASAALSLGAPSLVWDANAPGDMVTNYKVYEHVGTTYNLIATVAGTVTTYSLAGVSAGPHVYAVSAVNISGESPKSAETILPALPSAPANLRIAP
jgi:hypothetical protein